MAKFAGHFPTKTFTLAEWSAMGVWPENDHENWPGDGYKRSTVNNRPIVFYVPPLDSGEVHFVVRPVVRVPMGRA